MTPQTDNDDPAHTISSSMFDQTKFVVALVTVMSVVLAAEAAAGSHGYQQGYHGESYQIHTYKLLSLKTMFIIALYVCIVYFVHTPMK